MGDIIEKLANEYLRQDYTNTKHLEEMRERHEREKNSLMMSIEEGQNNPWNAAFRELGVERTPDLVERVAGRLREMQK